MVGNSVLPFSARTSQLGVRIERHAARLFISHTADDLRFRGGATRPSLSEDLQQMLVGLVLAGTSHCEPQLNSMNKHCEAQLVHDCSDVLTFSGGG